MIVDLTEISVQRVEINDIDEMINHRINYLVEMQGERDSQTIDKLKDELKIFFQQSFANKSIIALIAKHKKTTVSYGVIILHNVPGDFSCSSYLEGDILNMYTIPEARRQGISTLILKQLIAEAKLRGVIKLALHTSVVGEKLYRLAGFKDPEFPFLEMNL